MITNFNIQKFQTSFPPNSKNKTTSVAINYNKIPQPHYLIKNTGLKMS